MVEVEDGEPVVEGDPFAVHPFDSSCGAVKAFQERAGREQ
jgi:hypothetical protein